MTTPFAYIALTDLVESPLNPRRVFDPAALGELAASIRSKGIVQPLVVRQLPVTEAAPYRRFEIVAGARRHQAAALAGLEMVPCIVREYSDEDVRELFLVENLQRTDLSPLEQARGFAALLEANAEKYSPATIAEKVGMSPAWVWDRLRLLALVPEAKTLLEQDRISVGHAIVLSRLKEGDQVRAIQPRGGSIHDRPGGLWQPGIADGLFEDPRDRYSGLKPVSVRELEAWVAQHVRFDVKHAAQAQPLQFEEVAATVAAAEAGPGRGRHVVAITFGCFVQPDARTTDERIYTPKSFRLADGHEHLEDGARKPVLAPTCERSVLGVVVAGAHRGETFRVCVSKDKCDVHWKAERAARAKEADLRAQGQTSAANRVQTAAEKRNEKENERRRAAADRWQRLLPALGKASLAAVEKMSATKLPRAAFAVLVQRMHLPAKTTPATLAHALLKHYVTEQFSAGYSWAGDEPGHTALAKALGVDVKAIVASIDAPPAPAQTSTPSGWSEEGGEEAMTAVSLTTTPPSGGVVPARRSRLTSPRLPRSPRVAVDKTPGDDARVLAAVDGEMFLTYDEIRAKAHMDTQRCLHAVNRLVRLGLLEGQLRRRMTGSGRHPMAYRKVACCWWDQEEPGRGIWRTSCDRVIALTSLRNGPAALGQTKCFSCGKPIAARFATGGADVA